jgi:hypothetical protein
MEGYRREAIFRIVTDIKLMEKYPGGAWDITIHSIDKYLVTVHEILKEMSRYDAIEELGRARARMDDLYGRAKRIPDKLAVAKELHELQGLKELKISLGGRGDVLKHITLEIIRPKSGNGAGNGSPENSGEDEGGDNES